MTRSWLLGVSFAALLPVSAAGQDEQPLQLASVEPLDQIVVYGTKVDRSLQDVTSSVAVATGEEILREPIIDLYDIIDRIPNVSSTFGGLGFSIRGVDQRGVAGNGATLTVYVDDSPLSNQTTFFGPLDSWDLQQVEVYRGPQSTNFGRNSLAGAIYVRTQDPNYEWDAKLRGEVGNNGVWQTAVAVGGPIIEDKLAFRFAGNWRESDGFIDNTFLGEDADATELKTGRFKLLFEPIDTVKIISTSSYTENFAGEDVINPTNGMPGALLNAENVDREVAYDVPGEEGTETFIQSVNATWQVSERIELQSITTYQDTDYTRIEDFDTTPAPIAALDRVGSDEAWSEEFRIKYAGDRFSGVLGFYFFDNEEGFNDEFIIPGSFVSSIIPSTVLVSRVSNLTTSTTNYAGFLDGEYALTDDLDLLFGLRYDYEETENVAEAITDIANPPIPDGFEFLTSLLGTSVEATDASYDAWLPKAGVRWDATSNATLSFVVQRAYRAGGSIINTVTGEVEDYDPEYLWNYELSARTEFLDGRLVWNTNVYYSDWTDQQVNESLPPPLEDFARTINAGESTLYGVETDISYQLTDIVQVYGGVGYSVAEFDDFNNADFDDALPVSEANQPNFNGNRFPLAPELSLNAGVDVQHPTGLFGGVDVNYQSDFYTGIENFDVNKSGERTLVNARLGYEVRDGVRLSAYVRNALNEDFYTFLQRSEIGAESSRLGDERTYAVRLDFDF
ncbi:MAG: TonB-dependent receptor [Pseudomonadota bacterium]